ncbi:MAG: Ig-like domain-containing protein [Paludibacteraceae bacterium]|nr:Ig-like domain-containing protein [Paludibacteraceae bacterium]
MKNFNLLRKSERKSVGTTLALTVGSPSFDRRGTMLKHYAFMLLFLLGSLNVWGEEETITLSDFGWSNATELSSITATSATISLAKNSAGTAPTYYTSDGLRLYGVKKATTGGTISFEPKTGITISKIVFTHTSSNSGVLAIKTGTGSYSSKTWSGTLTSGNSVSLVSTNNSNSNPQVKITKIVITYETSGGGDQPTVSAEPNKVEFGTKNIYGGANTTGNIDVAVTGSHLTGNITATLSGDDAAKFSISGAPFAPTAGSASGTLVVSYEVTEARDYKALVTLSSEGADDVELPISLSAVNIAPIVYNKVTDAAELNAGDKVIFVYEAGSVAAGAMGENAYLASIDVSAGLNTSANPASLTITNEAVMVFTLSGEAGAWVLTSEEGKLSEKSHNAGSSCDLVKDGETTWTIAISDGNTTITGTDNYIQYNTSSPRFRTYKSGQKIIQLYKQSDGKASAGLAYAEADKSNLVKVGASFTAPTLTNPNSLTVAYTSSDDNVVAVDVNSGALTIKAAGKAEITASFAGNEDYKAGSAKYTIYVAEQAGTAEDPLTEASAKALIDLGCTLRAHVKGTVATVGDLNTNYGSISLTLTNGFQFYGMLNIGGSKFTENPFGAGDVVTAVGNLKKHNTTYELDLNCQLVERIPFAGSKTSIANTKETAYTVAQALAYAADPTTYDLTDHVYIAGVVYQVNSFNSTNGTYNIYIKDAGTSEDDGKFEFYKCSGLYEVEGTPAQFAEGDVQIGDEVIGYGVMTYFSGGSIWEFGQPNQLVSLNRPTVPVTSINLTESTATVEEGKTVSLHASVVPENASNKGITWSVQSGNDKAEVNTNGVVTGIAAGEAVVRATATADENIYAECTVTVTEPAPLSPWATVYSSNVTVGAEDYTIKILKPGSTTEYDEFEGMRYGTSNAPGVATITIPASTQALHFHAAAWNTETVTLEVKVGAETYPLTFGELVKEANIKGNGTTYELSTPIDEYYMLDLSSYTIADNTVITFTATGGKRFVLYGVNQEGGLVPELDRIEISGTATELEYEVGDVFNPAGLGANAIYTLGGDEQEPVAIDAKDIEWSFEPATIAANTTAVTVTATYEGKSAQTKVPVTVTVPEPEIIVSAVSLAFNNVAKEAAVADKELTVTLKSVENATLTITGDGASAFSVTPAALTASGTVAVSASSDNVGTFNATLTISDDAGAAEAKTVALSITVEASDDLSGTWNLVTDAAELMPGMQVIIASVADGEGNLYTLGGPNGTSANNRLAVASTATGTVLHPEAGTKVITLVDAGNGKYALQLVNGKYLYAQGGNSNNYLKERSDINDQATWTITFDEGKAIIKADVSGRNWMRKNASSALFSCYESGQKDIVLYAKPFDYTRNVSGNYATICLPKAGQIIGATLYEIAYYGETSKKIFFDEIVNGEMEAGIPYIFQPAAGVEKINVYYSDNTAENVGAGNRNGLIGFYDLNNENATLPLADNASLGNYILYQNAYWLVSGRAAYIANYRAYIRLADITPSEPTLAPGRRRISMSVNDTQTTTGVENGELINGENGVQKVLIDGELFILRGEKMYDAKGQLVK